MIPIEKNIVVSPKIVDAAPVTLPFCAATTWSATVGIRLTPTRMTMNAPIRFPSTCHYHHQIQQCNRTYLSITDDVISFFYSIYISPPASMYVMKVMLSIAPHVLEELDRIAKERMLSRSACVANMVAEAAKDGRVQR